MTLGGAILPPCNSPTSRNTSLDCTAVTPLGANLHLLIYGRCTSIRGSSRNRGMAEKKPPFINP